MRARHGSWVVAFLFLLGGVGCSTSPTGGLGLLPEHRLDPAVRAVAQYGSPLPLPRELEKQVLHAYVVEPGDVLLVTVLEAEEPVVLPGDLPVILDGTIDLGGFGRPVVAGKTLPEIEALVREAIATKVKVKEVSVRLLSRASKVYYVLGEVITPGAYPLEGRETVLDGLMAAGGLTDRADRKKIILSRPTPPESCRIVLPICYDEIVQLGDTSTNYQLAPGDRIFVASRGIFGGLFQRHKGFGPCGGPQTGCPILGGGCELPGGGCAPPAGENLAPAPIPDAAAPDIPESLPAPGEK
ncbi:MAG TPA: polysaccharide biosynthesis/export family protein [Gemmataceae bacterium]